MYKCKQQQPRPGSVGSMKIRPRHDSMCIWRGKILELWNCLSNTITSCTLLIMLLSLIYSLVPGSKCRPENIISRDDQFGTWRCRWCSMKFRASIFENLASISVRKRIPKEVPSLANQRDSLPYLFIISHTKRRFHKLPHVLASTVPWETIYCIDT